MPRPNPAARRACRLTAAIAAVALALPAQAQRARKDAPAAPAKAPAAAPAPAAPGTVGPAAAPGGFFSSRGPGSAALGVGLFSGSKGMGLAVHADYGFLRTPPSWRRLELEWRLRAMFASPTQETDLTRTVLVGVTPVPISTGVQKESALVFEVGPLARVRYALGPKLALFLDAGAGIAQTVEKVETDEMYVGRTVQKQNVTALYVGGALGLAYDVNDALRVLLVPVGFSAHVGTDYSSFLPTLAVAYRL